jgi:hypothetical protein
MDPVSLEADSLEDQHRLGTASRLGFDPPTADRQTVDHGGGVAGAISAYPG